MREALFEIYTWISVFHTSMRNKRVEFNPYIYTLSKLYRFGYEISVFNTKHPVIVLRRHCSSLHRLMSLHGKMDVKICLMFIVAENTRSVNIRLSTKVLSDHHISIIRLFPFIDCH